MSVTTCLLASAALTWVMIMVAAELHTPTWTRVGAKLAFGNREALPAPSPLAARADRAAKNMLENMVLFTALVVAASTAHAEISLGATVFLISRLVYFPLYLFGVRYVRSVVWMVSIAGLLHIGIVTAASAHA